MESPLVVEAPAPLLLLQHRPVQAVLAQPIADDLLQHRRGGRVGEVVDPADGVDIEVIAAIGRMVVPRALKPWAYSEMFLRIGLSDTLNQAATVS
ncbi:hypothetical protein B2M20_07825 [Nitrobacter vulgaris]|uniref:Uncharacterized protein n=1 Tax=Nitrobacter vulgaris TaxID=29421 RepID=A0A1V4HZJ4_NITVU|nr:hypothetical protein B2M20_07825 [Nitrobacter vulgaris]